MSASYSHGEPSRNYDSISNTWDEHAPPNLEDKGSILSVYWKNGMLGAASYDNNTAEIQILHDIMESSLDFKILNALLLHIEPCCVVVCNVQEEVFLKAVKQLLHNGKMNLYSNDITSEDSLLNNKLHVLSDKYFKLKNCEQLVLGMSLASLPKSIVAGNRYIRGLVDFTKELTVSALGALLYFIDVPSVKMTMQITNNVITSLRILHLNDLVWMSTGTYESLQIFTASEHPSTHKWTPMVASNKEDRSVLSVLNRCCNQALSYKRLKMILAHPTNNLDTLFNRHEVIEFCLTPQNESIIMSITTNIKRCYSISSKCNHCVFSFCVSQGFIHCNQGISTVVSAVKIGEICAKYSNHVNLFKNLEEALTDKLYIMANSMSNLINFQQSTKQGRLVINLGWIDDLDAKKSHMQNILLVLDEVNLQELEDLPPYIEQCSMIKIPEIGFLLAIPFWKPINEMTEEDFTQIPGIDYQFLDAQHIAYYKTPRCLGMYQLITSTGELDEAFNTIESSIIQDEVDIMIKLVEFIMQSWMSDLMDILILISELDCLIGFAAAARALKLTKPNILPKDRCCIDILNGRHILQQTFVDHIVPNSYNSSETNCFIQIINGFNASGKSVYLKQVALIAYLSHIGSYVPAKMVKISALDHIHTRIQSNESISTLMSAFMIDLRQMSVALNESTCRSLIVLDEFGKGTSDTNGQALLLASIVYFARRQSDMLPHVIISTHFHSLPSLLQLLLRETNFHNRIKYFTMSHKIENNQIEYLYKVVERRDGEYENTSMAHYVAASNGLPISIVQRATQVLENINSNICITHMKENLRCKLFFRRKEFVEQLLSTDGNINDTYDKLLKDLEDIRYP
ncbi:mutS protein homolog 5-like [Adelges cooleyi]|uniref:mutS protein homolog 5-like n=1 Tax=Adelges cooleyi TaxID=133065 RepID=UPI00217FAB6B|nr:mutS protein homolog 5-like [Adelges cooleyi]